MECVSISSDTDPIADPSVDLVGIGQPCCVRSSGVVTSQEVKVSFGHEQLDVYQLSISYVARVLEVSNRLGGLHRITRDQWLRASQSIPLNIAEGNGRATEADRRRFFEIARGSALECSAIQDVLMVANQLSEGEHSAGKSNLERIVAMLCRLGGRGFHLTRSKGGMATFQD